jgi:hypothetical protein
MKRSIASLLLGLALCAPAVADPVMGPANAFASPVSVNSCNLEYTSDTNVGSRISGVTIQFTNESAKVSDLINFRVLINGQRSLIRDVGTFTPGIEIVHKFRAGSDQWSLPILLQQFSGRPPVTCHIDSIHFADGTTWQPATEMPGATSANGSSGVLVALPARVAFAGAKDASRLVLVNSASAATLAVRGNCTGIATIALVAHSSFEAVYRIAPRGSGYCAATVVDAIGNAAMIPIVVK